MATTLEDNYSTTLWAKIETWDTTITVATAPTSATAWSLYITRWAIQEWMSFTGVSWSTLTWVTRALSKTTGSTAQSWVWWTKIIITIMSRQLVDKLEPTQLLQEGKTYATATARDTALWADWAATSAYTDIWVTADWLFYNYNLSTNQWESVDTWTATPNSSTTVAWKAETATSAETIAWTATWGTWANLIALPSDIAANIQSWAFINWTAASADTKTMTLTPTLTAYAQGQLFVISNTTVNTWAVTLNIDTLWAKAIQTLAWGALVAWDMANTTDYIVYYDWTQFKLINTMDASETRSWLVERATDAEVTTWSDTTRYTTPKQLKDSIDIALDKVIVLNYWEMVNDSTNPATVGTTGYTLASWATNKILYAFKNNSTYTSISSIVLHTIWSTTNSWDIEYSSTSTSNRVWGAQVNDNDLARVQAYVWTQGQVTDVTLNAAAFNWHTLADWDLVSFVFSRDWGGASDTYTGTVTVNSITITLA